MKKIYLHGRLKSLIDNDFLEISVRSPLEAIRFLCGVLPGFSREYFAHAYCVRLDRHSDYLDNESAQIQFGKASGMHIVPDVGGAKVGGGAPTMTPEASAYESREDDSLSALFNGGINTTEQGMCAPVIYGRVRRAGSAVISAGISVEEQSLINVRLDIDWSLPAIF
ncbi:hypothetical protein TDB9533_01225 [Thalassocella blandensis]|nr:hypothetical protein TDB9533_01225 [Thalassocella blandensis]